MGVIGFKVLARERLTPTSAIGFTVANIPPLKLDTEYVIIQVVAGVKINMCIDGTPATTNIGHILTLNSSVEVHGGQAMINFSCIDNGGASTVECTYMGRG